MGIYMKQIKHFDIYLCQADKLFTEHPVDIDYYNDFHFNVFQILEEHILCY